MLLGRVLIDGETWNAELDRAVDDAPEVGAELVVVAVDPSKLRVSVK
jgi:membrane protein implicated in regulation of membrane protease activity